LWGAELGPHFLGRRMRQTGTANEEAAEGKREPIKTLADLQSPRPTLSSVPSALLAAG